LIFTSINSDLLNTFNNSQNKLIKFQNLLLKIVSKNPIITLVFSSSNPC